MRFAAKMIPPQSTPLNSTRSPVFVGAIPCGRPFCGYLIVITPYRRAPARGAPTRPGPEFVVYFLSRITLVRCGGELRRFAAKKIPRRSTPLNSTRSPVFVGAIPCGRPFCACPLFLRLSDHHYNLQAGARKGCPYTKPGARKGCPYKTRSGIRGIFIVANRLNGKTGRFSRLRHAEDWG